MISKVQNPSLNSTLHAETVYASHHSSFSSTKRGSTGSKNRKHKQFLHVIVIQSNFKYLFPTSVKCSDYAISPFDHKLVKTFRVVSAQSRFGPESFRPWVVSAWVISAWVVSALGRFGQFWWVVSV